MSDKRCSIDEAIASIESGMTVGIGGWGARRKPMALVRALARSDVQDLTLVAYGGADVGILCAAGKVKKLVFAFVTLDAIPLEPYFRLARQAAAIEIMELDEGLMLQGLQAAMMGVPYVPTSLGLGTDVTRRNPALKMVQSPYGGDKEWLAMPALKFDVSLVHVTRADTRGVCEIASPDLYMDNYFVRAADTAIVSCDEIVESDYFHAAELHARRVFWERSCTSKLVHLPMGAHPSSSGPLYGPDMQHFKAYSASAKEEGGWQSYFDEYVAVGHDEYIARVGGEERAKDLPLPVY